MSQDDEILAIAREGFLDEARDMLRQFEQALLAMEQDPGDAEAMNSAFRAAYTVKETLQQIGIGKSKLYRELADGRISARKVGRKTIFLAEEVQRYLASLPRV